MSIQLKEETTGYLARTLGGLRSLPLPASVEALRDGYGRRDLGADLVAGLTVGVVALPLAMAFAIASGVGPERGLFTAIVAGFLISALGGSRYQIGGPTGAFVVVVYAIVRQHGYEGLVVATFMAGFMMILMGLFRFGAAIKFIPYPVTTGITAGIAVIIFSAQIKDFLGMPLGPLPPEVHHQWGIYLTSLHTIDPWTAALSILSVIGLLVSRRIYPAIPGPLLIVGFGGLVVWLFDIPVQTIETRFGEIPKTLPSPSIPSVTLEQIQTLLPSAVTIALLGGIESLMSAVVADGMTGRTHHSNRELVGQGVANIFSALFGGIPATGAIARTVTNIRVGGRTPLSGMIHAVALALFMFFLAPLIVKIPLASLAAILVVVAWNMAELKHFKAILSAPRDDAMVLVLTFLLTALVDLTLAVQVGVVLASLLFVRRMMEVTEFSAVGGDYMELLAGEGRAASFDPDATSLRTIPDQVQVYEINGPFFFGVADRLKHTLLSIGARPVCFILRLRHVPMIDATAIHALDELREACAMSGTTLILSGVREKLLHALDRAGFPERIGPENVTPHIDLALERAAEVLRERERTEG
ncbi:MAG: STAS domain-containing protein [Nitrospinae bacterium]|nr:STAS domain-containing protein [Nitrospinota bacterium]